MEPVVLAPVRLATPVAGRHRESEVDDRIHEFVAEEYRKVVSAIELVCGSLPTAEDSVQEALVRAWERASRGEDIRSLGAWVTTVAMNLARSQMRRWRCERRVRDRLLPLTDWTPDTTAASGEAHAVRQALLALPRRQREVTVLRYYLGLDVAEISAVLSTRTGTVKSLLFRAREALATALADDQEPDDA